MYPIAEQVHTAVHCVNHEHVGGSNRRDTGHLCEANSHDEDDITLFDLDHASGLVMRTHKLVNIETRIKRLRMRRVLCKNSCGHRSYMQYSPPSPPLPSHSTRCSLPRHDLRVNNYRKNCNDDEDDDDNAFGGELCLLCQREFIRGSKAIVPSRNRARRKCLRFIWRVVTFNGLLSNMYRLVTTQTSTTVVIAIGAVLLNFALFKSINESLEEKLQVMAENAGVVLLLAIIVRTLTTLEWFVTFAFVSERSRLKRQRFEQLMSERLRVDEHSSYYGWEYWSDEEENPFASDPDVAFLNFTEIRWKRNASYYRSRFLMTLLDTNPNERMQEWIYGLCGCRSHHFRHHKEGDGEGEEGEEESSLTNDDDDA